LQLLLKENIMEKVKILPDDILLEVDNFIDILQSK